MKCQIIAEIGANWNGDWNLAENMISAASYSGANYIKTQTWQANKIRSGPWDHAMDIYKVSQLDTSFKHEKMISLCNKYKIKYCTSVFDSKDLSILSGLGLKDIKIPGIEADNYDLLYGCIDIFDNIFISVCGLTKEKIQKTVDILHENKAHFYLMYGVYMYPCPLQYSNVDKMVELKKFHDIVGYSDHTQGPFASYYAVSLGAQVVERHFTIDNSLGLDNTFSCLPDEMKQVCDYRDAMLEINKNCVPDESFILDNFKGRWSGV